MPALKVVVTHRGAARAKYGSSGWRRIRAAITALGKADAPRGLKTLFFALDSASDVRKVGGLKVESVADAMAVKAVIDRIFAAWRPDYLLLLGGPDLVPQVTLNNPLWTGDPDDDPDPGVPSDLPYACDAGWSAAPTAFRGPTRAVGRLPDLTGVADADHLVGLLRRSAAWTSRVRAATVPIFALSTRTWRLSTERSVASLAGVTGVVRTSPTEGPAWTKPELAPIVHLVNCHGGEFDPRWYGEQRPNQSNPPVALEAPRLEGKVPAGSIVSTECCYGTSHWPPAAAGGQPSVAMTYLLEGANAVFGSSTTAYGPSDTNDYADVICGLFLAEVLGGASLGRAALTARQRYIQGTGHLDPIDLKTLAQFDLLGDPSVHPLSVSNGSAVSHGTARRRGGATPKARALATTPGRIASGVAARRSVLAAMGAALEAGTSASTTARPRAGVTRSRVANLAGRELPAGTRVRTFDAQPARTAVEPTAPVVHVAYAPPTVRTAKSLVVVRESRSESLDVRVVIPR